MWLPALLAAGAGGLALLAWPKRAYAYERSFDHPTGHSGAFKARLTTYHPLDTSSSSRRMEGPPVDRRGKNLFYLEDALSGDAPWVSVSGDPAAWPYGQLFYLDVFPGIAFRVVDDGANFMGDTKKYREPGYEPLDIAVRSASTKVPTLANATFIRGDTLDKSGKEVAISKLRGQNVTFSGYCVLGGLTPLACVDRGEAFTDADHEALARAITSSCPQGSIEEKQAVGWVCRNRAARTGKTILGMIAPDGYGPRNGQERDFVSTEKDPDDISKMVAKAVLAQADEDDPTEGAIDFWNPDQQDQVKALADIHALLLGEEQSNVLGANEIRDILTTCGLHVVDRVGSLELLT